MKKNIFFSTLIIILFAASILSAQIQSPEAFFKFKPGSDRQLINYEQLISYLQKLDGTSDRLQMKEIGASPLGRPMYIAFISAPENLKNLEKLRSVNKQLARNAQLPDDDAEKLIAEGKVFVLLTMSMHSGEVGPSQATPLIAYELLATQDKAIQSWLDDVVLMIVPSHNPDGMDMVVKHYLKYRGTRYEGSSMPGVYHKYVGHDNNRDFITLSQQDTRVISRIFDTDWFPQVMVEKHQMGSRGPRYFVPPMHDPIAENIDAKLWNWTWVFGSNLAKDMTAQGLAGVSQHYLFDDYWPGSTETCIWKNVIGMLTECASARYATPVYVEPTELSVGGKGLSEYKKSINMTMPWPGGWWRLADIVRYEIVSTKSILKTAALHREEILRFSNRICKRAVAEGKQTAPYYFILPQQQMDASELVGVVRLLKEHGVQVFRLKTEIEIKDKIYRAGDIVVPLAQPLRAFVKEVLEPQSFPARHYTPGGKLIRPYDITSWSMPLHRGLQADAVKQQVGDLSPKLAPLNGQFSLISSIPQNYWAMVLNVDNNESFRIAFHAAQLGFRMQRLRKITDFNGQKVPDGSLVILAQTGSKKNLKILEEELTVQPIFLVQKVPMDAVPLKAPRIALVETYFHDMDAGWTRFIFDQYHISYTVLHPGDFAKTNFEKSFDLVVFPDANKTVLMQGKWKPGKEYYVPNYPPEYTKGIGKKGFQKLLQFINNGGKVLAWGQSTALFLGAQEIKKGKKTEEAFQLPVNDVSASLKKAGLYVPGSLVRIKLKTHHALTLGLPDELGVFYRGRPAFSTSIPAFDMDRRVIGWFPEKNILLSGYAEKEKQLARKAALVWLKKGKGQLVLFAFNPQFRASTQGSFKLLFNGLLL